MKEVSSHLPVETRLEIERVDLLYQQNVQGMLALATYGASYLYMSWHLSPRPFLIIWGAILFTSALVRVFASLRWKKAKLKIEKISEVRIWLRTVQSLLLVSGLCWGTIAFLMPSSASNSQQLVTCTIVVLMAAGGVVAYSSSLLAMLLVFIPSMLPWSIALALTGDPTYRLMSVMIAVYMAIGIFAGRNLNRYVVRALRHNIEKDEAQEAHAANKAKSAFLANASHEIRTPLAAINGFADLLIQNPSLNADARRDLQMILRNGKYLVSLVNDLLDLSKIESGQIYIEKNRMSLIREVSDIAHLMRPIILSRGLKLEIEYLTKVPEFIESDVTRFREILINLLTNAAKFTEKGDLRIQISFDDADPSVGLLSLVVTDTGIGISFEAKRRLFRPFTRGENEKVQRVQGSGLGLALSRNLARLIGGDIRLLKSIENEGSSFEFTLATGNLAGVKFISPEETVQLSKEPSYQDSGQPLAGTNILVVDDALDLQFLMQRLLESKGAHVEIRSNGLEAVEHLKEKSYDLVLMDIKMPVMDGYTAASLLRKRGYSAPIVAVTAHASTDDRQLCYQAGFDSYVSKPVDFKQLTDNLLKQLGRFRSDVELTV